MSKMRLSKDGSAGFPNNTSGDAPCDHVITSRPKFDPPDGNLPRYDVTKTYNTFHDGCHQSNDENDISGHDDCRVKQEPAHGQDGKVFTIQEAVDSMGFGAFQIKMICIIGLANIAESMEMMMISVLSPTLKCIFHLDASQQSLLSFVVFLGMFVSSSLWGKLGDKYGRKTAVVMSSMVYGYFGVLTSFSPIYSWIVVNRFIVAFGLGGFQQTLTYCSEFLPTKTRGNAIVLSAVIWAMGSCCEILLAIITLSLLTWRWLLFFTACPTLTFIGLCKFLPESPRYHLSHGRPQEALDILKDIAKTNGKNLPEGKLYIPSCQNTQKNRFRDLFLPKFLRTTLLVGLAMATSYMAYFGTVLLTTSLLEINDGCHGYNAKPSPQSSCWSVCTTLGTDDYVDLFITSLGDIPGIFICLGLMYKFGRLTSLAILMTVYTVVMLLCNICLSRNFLVVLLFCAKAMGTGTSQGILVYIAEVYPTPIRAIGMGWCGTTRGLGVIIGVGLSTILVDHSAFLGISSYAAIGFIGALAFFFLPHETKNKDMAETLEESFQ